MTLNSCHQDLFKFKRDIDNNLFVARCAIVSDRACFVNSIRGHAFLAGHTSWYAPTSYRLVKTMNCWVPYSFVIGKQRTTWHPVYGTTCFMTCYFASVEATVLDEPL